MEKSLLVVFFVFFSSLSFAELMVPTWYHANSSFKYDDQREFGILPGINGFVTLSPNDSKNIIHFTFSPNLLTCELQDSQSRTIGGVFLSELKGDPVLEEAPKGVDAWFLVGKPTGNNQISSFYFEKKGSDRFSIRSKIGSDVLLLSKGKTKDIFFFLKEKDFTGFKEVEFSLNLLYPRWKLGIGSPNNGYFAVDGGKSPCILNGDGVK